MKMRSSAPLSAFLHTLSAFLHTDAAAPVSASQYMLAMFGFVRAGSRPV